ncbi:uncharacterized protein LOC125766569 isoform X3 [Anopheles funestus]|uniref:uncharacterized protein LOC125766569 isoform X1 n=1 Tax=Anopheles funestus TaxID=62324 RepID=UPI0020C5D187|nr:uncharacterized protein LOC125766569 isoform X1 [Anopheles funestus]XP_049288593.1 uncharacterized protein LOC125766569 isoform X2 [Anopheles funestus]XP_049288594.1 uncharacterized protein LOC125766569 isoform X3 [Anopheles funestus]
MAVQEENVAIDAIYRPQVKDWRSVGYRQSYRKTWCKNEENFTFSQTGYGTWFLEYLLAQTSEGMAVQEENVAIDAIYRPQVKDWRSVGYRQSYRKTWCKNEENFTFSQTGYGTWFLEYLLAQTSEGMAVQEENVAIDAIYRPQVKDWRSVGYRQSYRQNLVQK